MTTVEISLAVLAALGWVYAVAATMLLSKALDKDDGSIRIAEATRGDVVFDTVREAFANGQQKGQQRLEKAEALLQEMAGEACENDGGGWPKCTATAWPQDAWCCPCRARAHMESEKEQ